MLRKCHLIAFLIIVSSFAIVPINAQDTGFYSNKLHDFTLNVPPNWIYQENYILVDGTSALVIFFPEEFSKSRGPLTSPNIMVRFENIAESKIPVLNATEIEKYELEYLRTNLPNAKIINHQVKSTSWGWESDVEIAIALDIPFIPPGEFHEEDRTFYFTNRESYTVSYLSPEEHYWKYHHVFEKSIDTLVIKGVAVPEFHEIALMVLGGSIVFGIIFTRRFTKFKVENS